MTAGQVVLWLLTAVLKAGVLLGLAAGIAALLGRAPARTRHGVWAAALVGALLLPMLSPWLPQWSIDALPTPALTAEPSGALVVARPQRLDRSAKKLEAVAARADAPGGPVETGVTTLDRFADVSPAAWLLMVWVVGCIASLAWFLRALGTARRLESAAEAVDASWSAELSEARRRVGVRRPVRLRQTPAVATPMTWGWLRPIVLLPAAARGWSQQRRRIVLLHELVHIRRGDWVLRMLARLVCSVYWPNPLVWAAARRLAAEQEMACDEAVVALGTRPSSYARHLLAIARSFGPGAASPAHALDMARRSQMEGRLMSILDGGRRLRGGRKLAILALLAIAGLVPALAAIEPWVGDQETASVSGRGETARGVEDDETAGLARVLGELEALEREMEPFEAELESVELEMEPIAAELEGIEVELEPVEVELEGFEAEIEPFEEMLEAVELDMQPHLSRLEEIALELEPFEARLEAFEAEMEPFEEKLEEIEVELEPFEEKLEGIALELEPLARELERLAEQMEPLARGGGGDSAELERIAALIQELHQRMAPLHERMGGTHEEMAPIYERMSEVHREMEPLLESMGAIHQEMEPVHERMAAVHQELQPLYERMAGIHEQLEPVHERMAAVYERMRPVHERMGERHQAMGPFHQKMGEIHERMRQLYEEMGQRHLELERELEDLVERMLARDLARVTAADTDYAPVAARIVEAVSLRVDDGALRIQSSAPELREILESALAGQVTATAEEFDVAADEFVRRLGELEVEAE